MAYIIGAAGMLFLFVLVAGSYWLGTRKSKKKLPLNEEEKRKAAQIRKEFSEIMSYDVDKARGGS